MTGVITWVVDCGDGVYIEREQPSTALKPMPHITTWVNSYSDGIDAYQPEFQPKGVDFMKLGDIKGEFVSKANAHVGEDVDGFMKLGDIRGEFAPSRQIDKDPADNIDRKPGDNILGIAIARDHNHGNRLNWDVICDAGTVIKQTSVADPLNNGGQESYTELEWTYIKGDVWTSGSATSIREGITGYGFRVGLANGAGHDRITTGLGEDKFTTGAGGDSFNCDDILLGHGVGFINHNDLQNVNSTIDHEMVAGTDLRSDNRFVFEPMDVMPSLGGSFDSDLDAAGGFQAWEVSAVQIGRPPEPKLWLLTLG